MNLIESSIKLISQGVNIEDVFNYMTEFTSAKEHQTVYLWIPVNSPDYRKIMEYRKSPYVHIYKKNNNNSGIFVTTSYSYMMQEFGDLLEFYDYNNFSERRITFEITCSNISACTFLKEFKHFAIEKVDKYNDNIDYVRPYWVQKYKEDSEFGYSLYYTEQRYLELINEKVHRINASEVLPGAKSTTLYITGFVTEWIYIVKRMLDYYKKLDDECEFVDMNVHKLLEDIQLELKKYSVANKLTIIGTPMGTIPA